jgi:hypothetical protein
LIKTINTYTLPWLYDFISNVNECNLEVNEGNWDSVNIFAKIWSKFINSISTEMPQQNSMEDYLQLLYLDSNQLF